MNLIDALIERVPPSYLMHEPSKNHNVNPIIYIQTLHNIGVGRLGGR